MEFNQKHHPKISDSLKVALEEASEKDVLTTMMQLDNPNHSTIIPKIPTSEFFSRTSWRQALIEARAGQLESELAETIQSLKDLSLTVKHGRVQRTAVVIGEAKQIVAALELPGVTNATLNREIRIELP